MAKSKKIKFVEVMWQDATGYSGWKSLDEILVMTLTEVVSRGLLLYKDNQKVIIAGSQSSDGDYGSIDVIPAAWVKKIKNINLENL